jgi:hypothetical protein
MIKTAKIHQQYKNLSFYLSPTICKVASRYYFAVEEYETESRSEINTGGYCTSK